MGAMPDVFTAALGGTVVFALTTAPRAAGLSSDVRTHDAMMCDRDDQLGTWVADRNHELARESKKLRDAVPGDYELEKTPEGGFSMPVTRQAVEEALRANREERAHEADVAIAEARAAALHQYRDEGRRARLDVARTLAEKGWPHRLYRRALRKRAPDLTTPVRAVPVWTRGGDSRR